MYRTVALVGPARILVLGYDSSGGTITKVYSLGGIYQVGEHDNPLARRSTKSQAFLARGPGETVRGQALWTVIETDE